MGGILLAILLSLILVALLIVFIARCCCRSGYHAEPRKEEVVVCDQVKKLNTCSKIFGFHDTVHEAGDKKVPNYYVMRHGVLTTPLFKWSDHPCLIKEAAEQGWTRFGFIVTPLSSSSPTTWSFCSCDNQNSTGGHGDLNWVVASGGSECMQKIELCTDKKGSILSTRIRHAMAILPLPGPTLASLTFPQQAYFEIIFLPDEGETTSLPDVEKQKLIPEASIVVQSDSVVHASTEKSNIDEGGGLISVGLTSTRTHPHQLPGSYPGSIGFCSDGSVHLDGIEIVSETKQAHWVAIRDEVIGCGFSPRTKKVIFTRNSQLMCEICCKLEDFGSPLYPVLSATVGVRVLVNFGQCPFKYEPANLQRTPNPRLLQPLQEFPSAGGLEDSREISSMERADSQFSFWSRNGDENWTLSSEDLFEIVLDDKTPSHSR